MKPEPQSYSEYLASIPGRTAKAVTAFLFMAVVLSVLIAMECWENNLWITEIDA